MIRFIVSILGAIQLVLSLDHLDQTALNFITESNRTSITPSKNAYFILFTNDKCNECITHEKELDNVFGSVTKALKASPSSAVASKTLIAGTIDIHKHPDVADLLDVSGVPTLMLINTDEEIIEYSGAIKTEPLTAWLSKYLDSIISKKLLSKEQVKQYQRDHEVSIVAELTETDLEPLSQSFRGLRHFVAYAWFPIEGQNKERKLILSKNGTSDPMIYKIEGDLNSVDVQNDIFDWVQENQIPFLGEIDLSNLDSYLHKMQPMIWYIGDRAQRETFRTAVIPLYQQSNSKFKREFWWVWLDPNRSETHGDFVKHYLKPKQVPSIVLTDLDGAGRFQLDIPMHGISAELVQDWISSVLAGKESRELMSADPPENPINKDGTTRLVTSTTQQWLRQVEQKALLFLVETVWCTDCGQVLAYLKDSEKFKSHAHCLSVGRIDGSANELDPHWNLSLVPGVILMKRQPFTGEIKDLEQKTFEKPFEDADSFWSWVEDNTGCTELSSQQKKTEL